MNENETPDTDSEQLNAITTLHRTLNFLRFVEGDNTEAVEQLHAANLIPTIQQALKVLDETVGYKQYLFDYAEQQRCDVQDCDPEFTEVRYAYHDGQEYRYDSVYRWLIEQQEAE